MAHSAAANARRRAYYREGRLLGLNRREAGHLTSQAKVDAVKARGTGLVPAQGPSLVERQESYLAARNRERVTPLTMREYEERGLRRAHNRDYHYTKVRIHFKNRDTGEKESQDVTLTSAEPLTLGEIGRRVQGFIEKARAAHRFSYSSDNQADRIEILQETHFEEKGRFRLAEHPEMDSGSGPIGPRRY